MANILRQVCIINTEILLIKRCGNIVDIFTCKTGSLEIVTNNIFTMSYFKNVERNKKTTLAL